MYRLRLVVNNPFLKGAIAIALGTAVSIVVFWFMALATQFAPRERNKDGFDKIIEFVRVREEREIVPQTRPIVPPKPTPPPPEIPIETDIGAIDNQDVRTFTIDTSALSMSGAPVAAGRGVAERGLIPISGLAPNYPRAAFMRGIEGNVELEFVINEKGEVTDIVVVASANGDYFVETAIRALSRWRFSPKIVNGKPARQLARQSFNFKLDQ
ncbi:MAG: energy transducer TonB [Helicobacteraceae bacterium]|jgi:protein TonB|nr:energy transducer TonB [Helicobacteraceae bacterium]